VHPELDRGRGRKKRPATVREEGLWVKKSPLGNASQTRRRQNKKEAVGNVTFAKGRPAKAPIKSGKKKGKGVRGRGRREGVTFADVGRSCREGRRW